MILSNFYPAPFNIDGEDFLHVVQYYQHNKAIHHHDTETAERIMRLSNPRRIKALGDNIEGNSSWLDRRMMILYDGVKAKFDQNWDIQQELAATKGKHLYEATTDTYFGCGIGYESKRWQQKDWPGENVAGLIVKKVRDELLGLTPNEKDNTLIEIESQDNVSLGNEMETSPIHTEGMGTQTQTDGDQTSNSQDPPLSSSYKDEVQESKVTLHDNSRSDSYSGYVSQRGRAKWRNRGRGQGRGRGSKGGSRKRDQQAYTYQEKLSASDREFLGLKERPTNKNAQRDKRAKPQEITSSTPKQIDWSNLWLFWDSDR